MFEMDIRSVLYFFFQAEDGIRDMGVTGVQTCALPICPEVPEEVAVRVARRPLGYRPLPLDHQGTVARLPGARFVLLLQPVCDDGLAAPHHLLALVVGMVGVGGRSEERRVGQERRSRRS